MHPLHMSWQDRIKTLFSLFKSNEQMKYFPSSFVLRDPIQESLNTAHLKGRKTFVMLFDVKNYRQLKELYDNSTLASMDKWVRKQLEERIPMHFLDKEILHVQKYQADDYVIILQQVDRAFTYELLHDISNQLRICLEEKMVLAPAFELKVKYHSGFSLVSCPGGNTSSAFFDSLDSTRVMAKNRIDLNEYDTLKNDIHTIVKNENIYVLAQPILSLKSGRTEGWEILTRGPRDTPFHSPLALFNFAQQAGLLFELELLVFRKAVKEIAGKGISAFVFINITPLTLGNPHFYNKIIECMKEHPTVSHSQIVLEITERYMIEDYDEIKELIGRYRKAGFRFAVDDTGSGYANLYMISELLPDIIKVDRFVTQDIDTNIVKEVILQALLHIAASINCKVVAEGIETEDELLKLVENSVHLGQGYFFSRPAEPFSYVEKKIPVQLNG